MCNVQQDHWTDYQFDEHIEADVGDIRLRLQWVCGFRFKQVAPDHYAVVPKEANEPRPRALEYYDFLAALAPGSTGGWHEFELPGDARCGDINAWRFAEIKVGQDQRGVTVRGRDSKTGCRDIYGSRNMIRPLSRPRRYTGRR